MPRPSGWKLAPPRAGKTTFWYVRGTYLGIKLDDSTDTRDERTAKTVLATWKRQAERGEFRRKRDVAPPEPEVVTRPDACVAYQRANGPCKYLAPTLKPWERKPVSTIDQIAIDELAAELYPDTKASTKNRQLYTPVSAALKHVGIEKEIKRPKGWRGKKSQSWLEYDKVQAVLDAAYEIEYEFGLFLHHLAYTGQRLSEALNIRLRQLHLERAFVYLGDSKTGEPRGVHLPPHLVQAYRHAPPRGVRLSVKGRRWRRGEGGRSPTDAGVPFLKRDPETKLFRFHVGGSLRKKLKMALAMAGLRMPRREGGFHLFCHTYGTGMTVHAKLDSEGLTRTGRWKDAASTGRYRHSQASEEARRADLLPQYVPTRKRGRHVERKRNRA